MMSRGRLRFHHGRRPHRGARFWIPTAIGAAALYLVLDPLLANFVPWLPAVAIERPSYFPAAYYPNCDAARAAGVAPIRIGEPGYRQQLDRDGDGWACEPIPRR